MISICRSTCDQVSGDIVVNFVHARYLLRFQNDKPGFSAGIVNQALDHVIFSGTLGSELKKRRILNLSRGEIK